MVKDIAEFCDTEASVFKGTDPEPTHSKRGLRGPKGPRPNAGPTLPPNRLQGITTSGRVPSSRRIKHEDSKPAICAARDMPFKEWAPKYLRIHDLDGNLVPFTLNEVQNKVDGEWEWQLAKFGYVRLIILKSRKQGVSSYVQAKMFRSVIEKSGWHAFVMAHDEKGCQFVFERTRDYAENLPDEMKRTLVRWNKREIAYTSPHSSHFQVNVARGRGGVGRGGDIHEVHLSEVAFWRNYRGQSVAQGQATAIMGSVPRVKGSVVVIESTANGAGNELHSMWLDAMKKKNALIPVFLSWAKTSVCRIRTSNLSEFKAEPEWETDEPRLRYMGLDDEQLAWRRWTIANVCAGDIDTFKQEYPTTWEEAFLVTGSPVFPTSIVKTRHAELVRLEEYNPTPKYSFSEKDGKLEDDQAGDLRVFSPCRYEGNSDRLVITADPAGSGVTTSDLTKGDPACAYVWDRLNHEQVAEWHGWADADQFAQVLYYLGQLYGYPLVIPEAGPWGGHAVSSLIKLGYPSIYFRESIGEQLQTSRTDWAHFGWLTTSNTKPQMIEALKELWRDSAIKVNSPECCSEHLTFIKHGKKREAQKGCNDDRVICCAIYALWSSEHPYARPVVSDKTTKDAFIRDMIMAVESGDVAAGGQSYIGSRKRL